MSSNKSFSSETSDRYSKALFELSTESSQLDEVEKNVQDFLQIYNSDVNLKNFIKNPTQSVENQLVLIKKITELMKFQEILKNFFCVLVVKRRIFFLKNIFQSFTKLIDLKKGKIEAKLISSKKLSSEELKKISNELSQIIGSEITFDYNVDLNLIGGFQMQIGSLMIDTSIKNKLKKYEQIMLEN